MISFNLGVLAGLVLVIAVFAAMFAHIDKSAIAAVDDYAAQMDKNTAKLNEMTAAIEKTLAAVEETLADITFTTSGSR
nr:hypothetical protein Hi04_10k_c361_00002 [uncultured bacterium]